MTSLVDPIRKPSDPSSPTVDLPRRGFRNVGAITVAVLVSMILDAAAVEAAGPGWSPVIVPTGAYRQQLRQTPIHLRPNRPLHFYGNRVRRNYARRGGVPFYGSSPMTAPPTVRGVIRPPVFRSPWR